MFGHEGSYMYGMHGVWWIFWMLLVAAVVYVGFARSSVRRRPPETSREALQRRLSTGEITPEEYEQRKALLDRDARPGI